jgi:hypothetical protein
MNEKGSELKVYLDKCATLFQKHNRRYDDKVTSAFEQFPMNTDDSEVLFKVAVLNGLYACGLPRHGLLSMARKLVELKVDRSLDAGDLRVVDRIAGGKGQDPVLYSFAMKYCHWSRPGLFPMYDPVVNWMLLRVDKALDLKFANGKRPVASDMKSCPRLKENLDLLMLTLDLDKAWKYKRIHEGLYVLGFGLGKDTPAYKAWVKREVGKPPSWLE